MRQILFRTLSVFLLWGCVCLSSAPGQSPTFTTGKLAEREDREAFLTPPSQEDVETGYWKVEEGVQIHYFSEGSGAPVLFLHGGPGFPPHEAPKGLSLLKDNYQFFYYHQRGCGKSTRPFDRFDPSQSMENRSKLLAALGLEQQIADIDRIRRLWKQEKITLIGHSFGGFMATLYAAEFPERVEKLVLISPAEMLRMPNAGGGIFEAIKNRLPDDATRNEYNAFMGRYFQAFATAFHKSEAELADLNMEFGKYFRLALIADGFSGASAKVEPGYASGWMPFGIYFGLGMQYDLTPGLARIQCPVLIVQGDKDFAFSPQGLALYQECIEVARVKTIENASHFSFNDQPEAFAAAVASFLSDSPKIEQPPEQDP